MPMTPMRSTSLALLFLLVLPAAAAHAQAAVTKADSFDWPKSFSGQPDFAFTRAEALDEATSRAKQENEPAPALPTLPDLINDESKIDPLHLYHAQDVSSTTSSNTLALPVAAAPKASQLPSFSNSYRADLSEFRATLAQTVSETIATWHPDASRYSFGGLVNGLTLQTVSTSPVRYAVINGHRYEPGSSFQLKAPVSVPEDAIATALQAKMPVKGVLTDDLYSKYNAAYEEALSNFNAARTANPAVARQNLTVPVVVRSIEPRRVVLSVGGEEHELTVKFTY
ncbi:MAG: hypothetical protein GC129_05780 [Proteobacteria bacterium]|nr:hypothetical protein [Pseudomonadota bacterium]